MDFGANRGLIARIDRLFRSAQPNGNIAGVRQNEFLHLDAGGFCTEFVEDHASEVLCKLFDQTIGLLLAERNDPPRDVEVVDCVLNVVGSAGARKVAADLDRDQKALWFGPFLIRHTDAAENPEVLDHNRIHRDSLERAFRAAQSELFQPIAAC